MTVKNQVFAQLVVAHIDDARNVVLSTIHKACLERGINLTAGHGNRNRAQRRNGILVDRRLHDAELHILEILHRVKRLSRVEAAAARIQPAQADQTLALHRIQQILADFGVHNRPEVILALEQIRQRQQIQIVVKAGQRAHGRLGNIQSTHLHLFDADLFLTELTTGINLDRDATVSLFFYFIRKLVNLYGRHIIFGRVGCETKDSFRRGSSGQPYGQTHGQEQASQFFHLRYAPFLFWFFIFKEVSHILP